MPDRCTLDNYDIENPKKICEDNYHLSQDAMKMIELERNITNNDRLALVECINRTIEHATVEMEEVCYFAGFRPENLNLVPKDKVEQELRDMGYAYDEEIKKWKRVTVTDEASAEYRKEQEAIALAA